MHTKYVHEGNLGLTFEYKRLTMGVQATMSYVANPGPSAEFVTIDISSGDYASFQFNQNPVRFGFRYTAGVRF